MILMLMISEFGFLTQLINAMLFVNSLWQYFSVS